MLSSSSHGKYGKNGGGSEAKRKGDGEAVP
jgi:hypothetical protein